MAVAFFNISFSISSSLFLFCKALYSFIDIVSVDPEILIGDKFLTHDKIVDFATPYSSSKPVKFSKNVVINTVLFIYISKGQEENINVGLDIDISIRCFGEYSYRITNPILFYKNVSGNISKNYTRDAIDGQLKSELMTALQPAFSKISDMGIRYSALPGHTSELADALNDVLSKKWADLRGLEIVSFGVSSVKASEEDERMIKELQRNAAFRDSTMAAAHLVGAQAATMQNAASNEGAGSAMAFMGMNMAGQAGGMNTQNLYDMGQQQGKQSQPASVAAGWQCPCGHEGNAGKFCMECGKPQPQAVC